VFDRCVTGDTSRALWRIRITVTDVTVAGTGGGMADDGGKPVEETGNVPGAVRFVARELWQLATPERTIDECS
jgi:hypothetical protein